MFKQATGSWAFTRAALANTTTLDVRATDHAVVGERTHAALRAAADTHARFLIVEHGQNARAATEARRAIAQAVESGLVDAAISAQFAEGFIAALRR